MKSSEKLYHKRKYNPADRRYIRLVRGSRVSRRSGTKNATRNQHQYGTRTSKR